MNADDKQFEVVLCSLDGDADAFAASFPEDAPWLAIPYESHFRTAVNEKFSPPGVPTLTIVNNAGVVIELEGDACISEGKEVFEKWASA